LLKREQFYLDILFKAQVPVPAQKVNYSYLNLAPTAGNTLGLKHSDKFKLNRSGKLNPMFGGVFSSEFISMQTRNKEGKNNPMYGIKKSADTIAKLQKLIYVYEYNTKNLIGSYPTVQCSKKFKMGKDTLTKYLNNGMPFKNKLFSRIKLH
jgi:hypothetical protein